jgi:hypothetical protein
MGRLAYVDWVATGPDETGTTYYRPDLPLAFGRWAAFDLRSYGLPGALIWFPDRNAPLPARGSRIDLGDSINPPLNAGRATALGNRLGRDLSSATTPWDLVDVEDRAKGGRIKPSRDGQGRLRRRIRIGGEVVEFAPVIRGGAGDDFNRSASADLGANWNLISGGALEIESPGVVKHTTDGGGYEAWNTSFGADHWSEIDGQLLVAGFSLVAPCVRLITGFEYYRARICPSCFDVALGKRVAFSDTEFANGGDVGTSGFPLTYTVRLDVVGSALEVFLDTVSVIDTTDTDITAAGNAGIVVAGTVDHVALSRWAGDTLAVTTSAPPPPAHRHFHHLLVR